MPILPKNSNNTTSSNNSHYFNSKASEINWNKMQDLIPAIIQHYQTGQVLMLGYMNPAALEHTLATQKITFFSRSKQRLWQKGETSGHYLELMDMFVDCDQDSLLFFANPKGPTCHLGHINCFNSTHHFSENTFLAQLQSTIQERQQHPHANSYTSQLFQDGIKRIAQKVGEEGVEVALAAVVEDDHHFLNESADLLFHLLVLLAAKGFALDNVVAILQDRFRNKRDGSK